MYEARPAERTRQPALLHHFEDAKAGARAVLAPPYGRPDARLRGRRPPPHLGEHTDEVLRDVLGMDDQAMAELRARQVI